MLNTMNITEIMRLTDAVYECDKLDHGQNIDSFKEISNPNRIKRFVRFENRAPRLRGEQYFALGAHYGCCMGYI